MGNCFTSCIKGVLKDETIQVLRVEDGEVLQYKPPLKVKDVLEDNPSCDLVIHNRDEVQVSGDEEAPKALHADQKLRPGISYCIVRKKKDEIYDKRRLVCSAEKGGVVRVKIVMTKQELAQLLSKCGGQMEHVLEELRKNESVSHSPCRGDGWKPVLESIAEDP